MRYGILDEAGFKSEKTICNSPAAKFLSFFSRLRIAGMEDSDPRDGAYLKVRPSELEGNRLHSQNRKSIRHMPKISHK